LCASEQTALAWSAEIHYALLLFERGQPEGVQMYIGGGVGLVVLIIILVMFLR
jgi:hypothetical protein